MNCIVVYGLRMTVPQAVKLFNPKMNINTVWRRIHDGWPPKKALFTPARRPDEPHRLSQFVNGKRYTIKQAWEAFASDTLTLSAVQHRVFKLGWPLDMAVLTPKRDVGRPRKRN